VVFWIPLSKLSCVCLSLGKLVNRKHFPVKEKFGLVSRKVFSFYFGRKTFSENYEKFRNVIICWLYQIWFSNFWLLYIFCYKMVAYKMVCREYIWPIFLNLSLLLMFKMSSILHVKSWFIWSFCFWLLDVLLVCLLRLLTAGRRKVAIITR
jgi:hypothetical protein